MNYIDIVKIAGLNDVEEARIISLNYQFPQVESFAREFYASNGEYADYDLVLRKVEALASEHVTIYALYLLFVCHCYALLWDRYEAEGISREMFDNTVQDLRFKERECIAVRGEIGIVHVHWYWEFFALKRFAFGRLQFGRLRKYSFETYEKNGYKIETDSLVLDCHIPSGGPLTQEMCFDSYRRVWEFWHHLFPDNVVRILCGTHLFYPGYQPIMGENTKLFRSNFDIVKVTEKDEFGDSWRFFDTKDMSDPDRLPTRTSLQRRFVEYIKNGGTHGSASGVLLFDGENIVNK